MLTIVQMNDNHCMYMPVEVLSVADAALVDALPPHEGLEAAVVEGDLHFAVYSVFAISSWVHMWIPNVFVLLGFVCLEFQLLVAFWEPQIWIKAVIELGDI